MRFIAVVLSLAAASRAQQLLVFGDNALPTCAQSCTVLQSAQTGCIPPAAPVTDALTYESCFCQSGYLVTLKAAGSTLCSDVCTDSADVLKIASWYQSNCADNGVAAAAAVSTAATTTSPAAITSANAATAVPSNTSSGGSHGTTPVTQDSHHDWWTDHWKWVLMLIVLFVGLAIITVIGVWLRRRYHRRQDLATTPFNSGITRHSVPVLSVTPAPESKQTSRTSLPRVREKDRVDVSNVPVPPVPALPNMMEPVRTGTPDIERGQGKLRKNN